tara:strand:+ start:725 stop:1582 length:858 start_codon:yes stop_codon:yes gene_type:complete
MHLELDKNKIKNGLYIVATPIGNLGDITIRALDLLKKSDYIICEDTRKSKKLLSYYNINNKLISNHKFNEKSNIEKFINILKSNKILSLISDAGTPSISDPGRLLVKECIDHKINIYSVPGPSSVSASISVSGFSDKYYFHGFLPDKKSEIKKDFVFLSKLDCSIVFFISSKKINRIIEELKIYFKGRNIVICKEITKYYEEYFRSSVNDLQKFNEKVKGEITVVISENYDFKINSKKLNESDIKKIKNLINKMSIKDIVKEITIKNKISKKIVYNYCLRLKNEI